MQKKLLIYLIISTVILAGCNNRVSKNIPVIDTEPQAHLFQMTPTTPGEKGLQVEAQAKVLATNSSIPGYPTPLPTYLVPSNLTIITYSPTQVTSTTPTPTNTSTPVQPTPPGTTATATLVPPTATSTSIPPTATASVQYLYTVQPGSPALLPNFANASACNWQGIAGQVFDAEGLQVKNLVVKAGGTWNGAAVNLLGMTGTSTAYGEGGYELTLGTKAVISTNTVWVQVYDLSSKPLTDKVYISTSADCTKNLTLVNFKAIGDGVNIYIPMVIQTAAP